MVAFSASLAVVSLSHSRVFLLWESLAQASTRQLLLRLIMGGLTKMQRVAVILASIFYTIAGSMHFIRPGPYIRIMPPYLPWHNQLVAISGLFEILGGVGLLFPPSRRLAAWGLVALLVAVFPANLYMATNPVETGTTSIPSMLRWGRLPLQAVLIVWVLWCTKRRPEY